MVSAMLLSSFVVLDRWYRIGVTVNKCEAFMSTLTNHGDQGRRSLGDEAACAAGKKLEASHHTALTREDCVQPLANLTTSVKRTDSDDLLEEIGRYRHNLALYSATREHAHHLMDAVSCLTRSFCGLRLRTIC